MATLSVAFHKNILYYTIQYILYFIIQPKYYGIQELKLHCLHIIIIVILLLLLLLLLLYCIIKVPLNKNAVNFDTRIKRKNGITCGIDIFCGKTTPFLEQRENEKQRKKKIAKKGELPPPYSCRSMA